MSLYESLSLMFSFGMLLLTLISLIIVLIKAFLGTKK